MITEAKYQRLELSVEDLDQVVGGCKDKAKKVEFSLTDKQIDKLDLSKEQLTGLVAFFAKLNVTVKLPAEYAKGGKS
jgi:hypothetical protein